MIGAAINVLLLPGWQDSGPMHWHSWWERSYGDRRVQQHDWDTPLRGDWVCQLETAVLETRRPIVLAAHSLGCHLVAAWAETTRHADRVCGALLVAPPDLEHPSLPPVLHRWRHSTTQKLPFPSHLIGSSNDPYCTVTAAARMAAAWGSRHSDVGPCGHINSDSGLGNWPQGRSWLLEFTPYARFHPSNNLTTTHP